MNEPQKEYLVEVKYKSSHQYLVTANSKKHAVELTKNNEGDCKFNYNCEGEDYLWSTAVAEEQED